MQEPNGYTKAGEDKTNDSFILKNKYTRSYSML